MVLLIQMKFEPITLEHYDEKNNFIMQTTTSITEEVFQMCNTQTGEILGYAKLTQPNRLEVFDKLRTFKGFSKSHMELSTAMISSSMAHHLVFR